ncbi:DUF3800 domain-containing protein [Janthinobacterium sp. EB271-G4-7A]|uniref:DUF3800 domain-containing protein n=1 Tax=Janthinobacterium sp. EB271-G4-7A TaxID=2775056 RepID=UPI001E4385E9|nr:DUF3800 domain-containing protein [Janthinobacterium sp. EB271-G4-7A]MCC7697102.1 DUF3800 domain-containing protein [Janthinobacterium sp. EB271-G4-7A]
MKVQANTFGTEDPRLYGNDADLTLFYDETNNIRKLRLKASGLNDDKNDNFVLGGIVLKPGQVMADIKDLRKILYIQDNVDEIKFDLVAWGSFERILDSRKLTKVFSWLIEQDIGIHYVNLNLLNWSILDIVQSIISDEKFRQFMVVHRELQNELYQVAMTDLPAFLSIMRSHGYPNIQRSSTSAFLVDLRRFIQTHWPTHASQWITTLDEILLKAQSLPELAFLVDEKEGVLIDSFDVFFLNRICMFKNSRHVFDEEEEVQEGIGHYQIMDGERVIDFSFVNSKAVDEIQVSDVIVGFLGKYFSYIEKTPIQVLLRKRKDLTSTQSQNLKLFGKLIDISDALSNALLHRITTEESDWKSDLFLHGSPSR